MWTKVHVILGQCCQRNTYFVPKIQAVKVAIKLRSRPKKVVFGPLICRGITQILDMRFQIAVTSEHVADCG